MFPESTAAARDWMVVDTTLLQRELSAKQWAFTGDDSSFEVGWRVITLWT